MVCLLKLGHTRGLPVQNTNDYMKKGDLAASLVQCGDEICLCVIEIIEFQFGTEKTAHVTATLDDLKIKTRKSKSLVKSLS